MKTRKSTLKMLGEINDCYISNYTHRIGDFAKFIMKGEYTNDEIIKISHLFKR